MPIENNLNTKTIESKDRRKGLAYTLEFGQMLKENPGLLKSAVELADRSLEAYDPGEVKYGNLNFIYDKNKRQWFEHTTTQPKKTRIAPTPMNQDRGMILVPGKPLADVNTGLEVTVLGRSNRNLDLAQFRRIDVTDYFKFTFKGQSFFVKKSSITASAGFNEFKDTKQAEAVLAGLDFVKVASAQLGYKSEASSWYVSRWEDLEKAGFIHVGRKVNSYGETQKNPAGGILGSEDFIKKLDEIRRRLRKASVDRDVLNNLFFNPETGNFLILDITGYGKEKMLGQALK